MIQWRGLALGIAASVAIDAAAAYLLLELTGSSSNGDRLVLVAVVVALVWAVQIYAAAKQALVLWIFKNEAGAKSIAAMLAGDGFPPAAPHDDATRYLDRLAKSFADEHGVRERAIFLQGERAGFAGGAGMAKTMAFQATWDRAIHLIG